jgi:hypothetical protein
MRDEVGVLIGLTRLRVSNYLAQRDRLIFLTGAQYSFPILWTAHSRTMVDRYTKSHWDRQFFLLLSF